MLRERERERERKKEKERGWVLNIPAIRGNTTILHAMVDFHFNTN